MNVSMQTRGFIVGVLLVLAAQGARAEDIVLVGRLTRLADAIACGMYSVSSMSEYEVVKVLKGTYRKPKIYVVQHCIELPRSGQNGTLKKFKVGDLHKLVVSTEAIHGEFDGWFGTESHPKDLKHYYCKKVDAYRKWFQLHN